MTWKPIIAGVDASPEGGWAGAVACNVATLAGVPAYLVHAVPEVGALTGGTPGNTDIQQVRTAVLEAARRRLLESLEGQAPGECIGGVEVRFGRAAAVLAQVARHIGAGLIVLGAKEHGLLARWFAGNTAVDVARLANVPTLVATESAARVKRVMAAVDLSKAAGPTISAAEDLGRLFGAELRVLHAIEPVPLAAELPTPVDPRQFTESAQEVLEREVWPRITLPAERLVRHGGARGVIANEATEWKADVVVVGSHGKGWVDRLLLGSVTEELLRHLPASLVVVPAHPAEVAEEPARAGVAAALGSWGAT